MHNKYQTLGPSPRSLHLNSTPLWGSLLGTCSPLLGPGCAMAKFLLNETSRKNPTGDSQYETWFQMKTWKSWKDMWPQCQNPRTEYVRSNDVWCVSSGDLDILNMRGHQLWHFSQQCVCIYIYIDICTAVRWWRTRVNAKGKQIMVYVGARTPILIF